MFRIKLLLLACLAFSAQAFKVTDECCSGISSPIVVERPKKVAYVEKAMKLVQREPEVEYITERAPVEMVEEQCDQCEEPQYLPPPTPAPMPTPMPYKTRIEITQTPQTVTEPAPVHYEAPVDPCRHPNGCEESAREVAYVEQKELIPVRHERLITHHVQRLQRARPIHYVRPQRLQIVEAVSAAPCDSVCHASVGCCQ